MQGENDPAMAEAEKKGVFPGWNAAGHGACPRPRCGVLTCARQRVVDSASEPLGTERQQKLEDAVAEVIEVPAGLAEEAVKGAEVFEAAQLSRLDDARNRPATGAENPGAGQSPEGGEAGLGKAGPTGKQ